MCHAEIDQARFFVTADDIDRKAQRALGQRQKLARIFRHPKGIGRDRAHGGRMHARKSLVEALQAFDRGFHRRGFDSAVAVEAGTEAQCLAPGVLAIDLAALDATDLEPEAVRSQIDDGESRGAHAGPADPAARRVGR